MEQTNDDLSFPVTGWDVVALPAYESVAIRLHYISSPMQSLDDAHLSNVYALYPAQAIELAQKIIEAAQRIPSSPLPHQDEPQH